MDDQPVIAVDVGTSRSGYAFCTARGAPVQIGFGGAKVPTAALLDPANPARCLAFGRDALAADPGDGWLFERFKMSLHSGAETVVSSCGVSLAVAVVFEAVLGYLRERALEHLQSALGQRPPDCRWVVTIPAIWTEKSKALMREAALAAGLGASGRALATCLEPEGACVAVHREHLNGGIALDERFVVVDCGGGTVDVTVHRVEDSPEPFRVAGLLPPSGGPWGGTTVDERFLAFVGALTGRSPAGRARIELLLAWESAKLQFTGELPKKVSLAPVLADARRPLDEMVASYTACHPRLNPPLKRRGQASVVLPAALVRSFFEPALEAIEAHVDALLARQPVDYLFLVGGFAASPVLQRRLVQRFSARCRVVVPPRPGAAVVHGAVCVGREPEIFTTRCTRFTYGMQLAEVPDYTLPRFQDPRCKFLRTTDSGVRLSNGFRAFVQAGDPVSVDAEVVFPVVPLQCDQTVIEVRVLRTLERAVRYSDDEGVERVATMAVSVVREGALSARGVDVVMRFGGTALEVLGRRQSDGAEAKVRVLFESTLDTVYRPSVWGDQGPPPVKPEPEVKPEPRPRPAGASGSGSGSGDPRGEGEPPDGRASKRPRV